MKFWLISILFQVKFNSWIKNVKIIWKFAKKQKCVCETVLLQQIFSILKLNRDFCHVNCTHCCFCFLINHQNVNFFNFFLSFFLSVCCRCSFILFVISSSFHYYCFIRSIYILFNFCFSRKKKQIPAALCHLPCPWWLANKQIKMIYEIQPEHRVPETTLSVWKVSGTSKNIIFRCTYQNNELTVQSKESPYHTRTPTQTGVHDKANKMYQTMENKTINDIER